jgi:hypothetical protein
MTGAGSLLLDASEISSEAVGETSGAVANTRAIARRSSGNASVTRRTSAPLSTQASERSTSFGNGGDITLRFPREDGLIILLNGSRILTDAGAVFGSNTGGNGGDIRIATHVVASELLGNNDITANSVNNNGGTITITAPGGIFGLIERTRDDLIALLGTSVESDLDPQRVPTSDITAISQEGAGLDGEIVLDSPDIDPSRGNIELPSAFEETPSLETVCSARLDRDADRRSEFVFIGRGGLPIGPDDPIEGSRPMTPWVERSLSEPASLRSVTPAHESSRRESVIPVEAQGWTTNPQGKTVLLANIDRPSPSGELQPIEPRPLMPGCVSHSDVLVPDS